MHESTDESGFADNRRTLIGHWMDRQPIRARYILQPDSKEENTVPGFSDRFPEVKQVHFDGVTLIRDPDVFFLDRYVGFEYRHQHTKKGRCHGDGHPGNESPCRCVSRLFFFCFFCFFVFFYTKAENRFWLLVFGFFFGCGT